MDQGFYKAEGLDASFVMLTGRALVTAGLSGSVDFIPIPSGGAQAALSGAEVRYVVGEALKSQWVIVARPDIGKPEDLKDKTIGYGRQGSADYDEGAAVMLRAFTNERRQGLQGDLVPGRARAGRGAHQRRHPSRADLGPECAEGALGAGMKVLIRTGDYIQRAGGSMWTMKSFVDKNPDTVEEVHPRHRARRDVLPRQQGGFARDLEDAPRRRERRERGNRLGSDP